MDSIETAVEQAVEHVQEGNDELTKACHHQRRGIQLRNRKRLFVAVLLAVGLVIIFSL